MSTNRFRSQTPTILGWQLKRIHERIDDLEAQTLGVSSGAVGIAGGGGGGAIGPGTTNAITKWTSTSTIGDSHFIDDGTATDLSYGNNAYSRLFVTGYGYSGGIQYNSEVILRAARGVQGAFTAVHANDILGTFAARGCDSNNNFPVADNAKIAMIAGDNWSTSSRPTVMVFYTTNFNALSESPRMALNAQGRLVLYSPTNGFSNFVGLQASDSSDITRSTYQLPDNWGAGGQVLTTDGGSGGVATLSWQTVSGGGGIGGSGTANRVTKWLGTQTITNSSMTDDGTHVFFTIGTRVSNNMPILWFDHLGNADVAGITLGPDDYLRVAGKAGNGIIFMDGVGYNTIATLNYDKSFRIYAATSGYMGFKPWGTTVPMDYAFPTTVGAVGQVLAIQSVSSDYTVLTWSSGGGGFTGACPFTVYPTVTNTYDLGTSSLYWMSLYARYIWNSVQLSSPLLLPYGGNNTGSIGNSSNYWNSIYATYLIVNGGVISNLTPTSNNTFDLGSSSNYWNNLYATSITAGNIVPKATNSYSLGSLGSWWQWLYVSSIYCDSMVEANTLLPKGDNTGNIGSLSDKWQWIYCSSLYADSMVEANWVLPPGNNVGSLGSSSGIWHDLWVTNVNGVPYAGGGGMQVHSLLGSTWHSDVNGDTCSPGAVIVGNSSSKWAKLSVGTNGYVLTLVSGYPSWQPATGGSIFAKGSVLVNFSNTPGSASVYTGLSSVTGALATLDYSMGDGVSCTVRQNTPSSGYITIYGKNVTGSGSLGLTAYWIAW